MRRAKTGVNRYMDTDVSDVNRSNEINQDYSPWRFQEFVLYWSILILCNFILLLVYTSEVNIVLCTQLHLSDRFSLKFAIPFLSSANYASPNMVI